MRVKSSALCEITTHWNFMPDVFFSDRHFSMHLRRSFATLPHSAMDYGTHSTFSHFINQTDDLIHASLGSGIITDIQKQRQL